MLEPKMTLSDSAFLAITNDKGGVIEVAARNGSPTDIREFHGKSASGCLPEESMVSLVRSPGGELGTLLIVLGQGTIRKD